MSPATLAVLGGTGRQGRGIARRFAQAGFRILVGSRDPQKAAGVVAGWPEAASTISTVSYHDAIAGATVVFLAVPFDAVESLLADNRTAFRPNCLVVDVTVPLLFSGGPIRLATVPDGSAAEYVRARLPQDVRVAVAFKTLPARLLGAVEQPLDCDEFIAGDSPESRNEIAGLMQHIKGLRVVDVGPLSNTRSIEHLTLLAVGINRRYSVHEARFKAVGL
jgi:NADPH-dependent F420 reductase